MSKSLSNLPAPAFDDPKHHLRIYQGDCLEILAQIPESSVDLVFADPPYFLSNGGITCHAGRMVSVNKGDWDKSRGPGANHEFNRAWLAACQRVLKPNGSLWVSGTAHVIHSVGFAMQQLGFKLLNDISWVKPNPPPNLSCRYFTHSPKMSAQLQLVQQERRFYFIGRTNRTVIFSVLADSLDDAFKKFRASGRSDSDALFIIKTETERSEERRV